MPPDPKEKGIGAHTGWGCFTLLRQDGAGGPQAQFGGDPLAEMHRKTCA